MSDTCKAGFALPAHGAPCPECGATENMMCRRYAERVLNEQWDTESAAEPDSK